MMARPILASLTYSPPRTGTQTSSVPLRPSAMMTWQPVVSGLKPLRFAQSMCSSACLRLPGYSVLQSVRNGRPPCSLQMSATHFAYCGRRYARLPSSPKCILMATNLFSMSMSLMPAARQRRRSLSVMLVPTGQRKSVNQTFDLLMCRSSYRKSVFFHQSISAFSVDVMKIRRGENVHDK